MKLLYLHGTQYDLKVANNLQVFNMCQAFSQIGLDVTLAIPDSEKDLTDPATFIAKQLGNQPGFKTITYKKFIIAGRLQILGNYWGARSLLDKVDADLCFVRDPLLLKLAIQAGLQVIFEAHNSHFHNRSGLLRKLWEREVLKITKQEQLLKFVVISEALKKVWFAKGVPNKKLFVAHDGFNQRQFSKSKTKNQARIALGLPNDKKIVVYAGSLYEDRGIDRIISLAKHFPDVLFIIIGGDENQKQNYQDAAKKALAINTFWTGYLLQADVTDYLSAADILLMLYSWKVPTMSFCSPLKAFEYMAAGRIIVGEVFPTITEVLEHGKTAFLAKPDDFHSLCENLHQALHSDRASLMAEKAREEAFYNYTWEKRAKGILNSIEGMLN